ncbi:MAG: aldolase/citrate lyase family protein [Polyangiaceae bacterium]
MSSVADRARALVSREAARVRVLPPRFAAPLAHLTVPAPRWSMVERACARPAPGALAPSLIMLDLEDGIPEGDDALLRAGRDNVVRALRELDWGGALRFFRPRGLALDPEFEDVRDVVARAGSRLEGLVLPKVEHPDEVKLLDEVLTDLERTHALASGDIRVHVLVESVAAEERAFELAVAAPRVAGLVLGAFDYWSTLRMPPSAYRFDHPALVAVRARIVKAAAFAGLPAFAEMTSSFPTKDKSDAERALAIETCRAHAALARDLGMRGKWIGHPAQLAPVLESFAPSRAAIDASVAYLRAFADAKQRGLGAVMIDDHMADRATARMHEVTLTAAHAAGLLGDDVARELLALRT